MSARGTGSAVFPKTQSRRRISHLRKECCGAQSTDRTVPGEAVGEKALPTFQEGNDMRALFIGLAASIALAVPAQARSIDTVSVSIPYRDLDLTTAEGMKTFRQRSLKAIRIACARLAAENVFASTSEQSCRADALAQAMQQIEEKRKTHLAMMTSPTG